jgi:tRNA (guanine37-N1)-methyltransferase
MSIEMRIDFITLFPTMVEIPMRASMIGRAAAAGRISVSTVDPRSFTTDSHRTVDDTPYGGGPGMLMKAQPVALAIDSVLEEGAAIVMTDPTGARFTQHDAVELSKRHQIIFVCGHYEGIDGRIAEHYATHVLSIGDFVLTNGELPALVMADAIVRTLPGVLGSSESLAIDSHADGLLSAPQFTRPEEWRGMRVPEVLLSGNHRLISQWKRRESLRITRENRPDLFATAKLTKEDLTLLQEPAALVEKGE